MIIEPHSAAVIAPRVIWMTGLSGAGKTTVAAELERVLRSADIPVFRLDGDELRQGLNSDLGFSDADRTENIRRVAEVARLMMSAGLVVVVSLISPLKRQRAMAARCVGASAFLEVFIDTPLAIAESRDPKGLYVRARRGEIRQFTGIDAPYEPPDAPDIHIETAGTPPHEAALKILAWLRSRPPTANH